MTNTRIASTFGDPENWLYGPHFEVQIRFSSRLLEDRSADTAVQLPRTLGLTWLNDDLTLLNTSSFMDDWRVRRISLALWDLGLPVALGVKVLPELSTDLRLAVPPRFVKVAVGTYPWFEDDWWVNPAIIDFHRCIMDRLRNLHSAFRLQAALMQEESWTGQLTETDEGILIRSDIAHAAGFNTKERGYWSAVPL